MAFKYEQNHSFKETVSSFVENNITETIESKIKLLIINNL